MTTPDVSLAADLDASRRPHLDASPEVLGDASSVPAGATRACAWCREPIPTGKRSDSLTCKKACRQAIHRFRHGVGTADVSRGDRALQARRLAYADPPYPGLAGYYRDHADYGGEVDHVELVGRLQDYDGWALSTSARALGDVLAICPPGTRVAAWFKGERPTPSYDPLSAWEPVLYRPGRRLLTDLAPGRRRRVDALMHGVAPYTTLPGRVIGQKPAAFCGWLFDLLGALPGDTFDDLYPGSGAVSRAWATYTQETTP